MITPSSHKITTSVTMAAMTPAAPFKPPVDEVDDAETPDGADVEVVEEQTPVWFPQALHQDVWSPIVILFTSVTRIFHGITVS
jgi:hypothetical protein